VIQTLSFQRRLVLKDFSGTGGNRVKTDARRWANWHAGIPLVLPQQEVCVPVSFSGSVIFGLLPSGEAFLVRLT
jgi:hypothetical protein